MYHANIAKKTTTLLSVMLIMAGHSLIAGNAATQISFSTQPANITVGTSITNLVVQLKDKNGINAAQSGVAISLALNKIAGLAGSTNAVTDNTGKAKFTNVMVLTAGTSVSFQASGTGLKSATSSGFNVSKAATSTTLTTALNPALTNQMITFTAAISAGGNGSVKPVGSVQFKSNGTNKLGGTITLTNGIATVTVLAVTVGKTNTPVTAIYSDAAGNYNPSTNTITQMISTAARVPKPGIMSLAPSSTHRGWFNATLTGGTTNTTYVIQASTDMIRWVSIFTNSTGTNGIISLVDTNLVAYPARFYRAYAP